jgi:hypothetical protein
MIVRITEIVKFHGMDMNVKTTNATRISRQPSQIQIMIHQKQPGNVEYFNFLDIMKTYARCTQEIKSRLVMKKVAFNKKNSLFTDKLDLNLRKKQVNCYIWNVVFCRAEPWMLRKTDQKYVGSFEWMEISWADHERKEVVIVKEERNILQTIKIRKAKRIGHILCRNCLLQHVLLEIWRDSYDGRRGRSCKQLLDDLREYMV